MNPDDTAANRSDARRAQIIAAARDLYEERGLSHTTVKDITERVGVTRTLFYHYFPDKDAVTSAVIDDYTQDYIEALAHWNEELEMGRLPRTRQTAFPILLVYGLSMWSVCAITSAMTASSASGCLRRYPMTPNMST